MQCVCFYKSGKNKGKRCTAMAKPKSKMCGRHQGCETKSQSSQSVYYTPKTQANVLVQRTEKRNWAKSKNKARLTVVKTCETKFKKEMKSLWESILRKYNLTLDDKPMAQGGFADVYDLGDKLLHIELSPDISTGLQRRYVKSNVEYIIQNPSDFFPRIFSYKVHTMPGNAMCYISETVMEKLAILPWKLWKTMYPNENALIQAVKDAVKRLHRARFAHPDFSNNNVVLVKDRGVVFIDNLDMCNENKSMKCNNGTVNLTQVVYTVGFVPPELSDYADKKDLDALNHNMKQVHQELSIPFQPYTKPKTKQTRTLKALHYSNLYSAGSLLAHVLSQGENVDGKRNFSKLTASARKAIATLMHPDPAKRK